MGLIFHVTGAAEWAEALREGEYRLSTRGRTLEEECFIHCSTAEQVERVANAFYRGVPGLVLLAVAADRVRPEIRRENLEGGQELFPHVYGPLNVDAVVAVIPLEPGPDGRFALPREELARLA